MSIGISEPAECFFLHKPIIRGVMSRLMGILETSRLIIRPFIMSDLDAVHQILDHELKNADVGTEGSQTLTERKQWLEWLVLNYQQLSKLNQPPYGDRAIVLKESNELMGICGYVPCLDYFEQLCDFNDINEVEKPKHQSLATTELGLFYAISEKFQDLGFATEATFGMITYAFENLHVKRIIATTTYDNTASIQVMRKLGMQLKKNPFPIPSWLQVVGVLENK